MKTNEPSFQNYLVKDGQAVPENPFYYIMGSNVATDYFKFETWKKSHTYQTDAKDGSWPVERFDIVWQRRVKLYTEPETWVTILDGQAAAYKNHETPRQTVLRQFAKFKEEVEKPKESETTNEDYVSIEAVINVIKYMCGYTDFPEQKEGQGVYYWRSILRQKFEEIGVSFTDKDFVKAMHSKNK